MKKQLTLPMGRNLYTKNGIKSMSLSKIAKTIEASPTLKLNEKFSILKKQGESVIHLGGGEPKSKAPMDALVAAAAHLNTGEIRYAPASGTPDMKKAVVKYTKEFYNQEIETRNVIVSSGAKQSLMVALQTILDPEDELMFTAPYWVSYPDMARLCAAKPVVVKPADGTFQPTIKDFEDKLTSKTKAIILNSPNNPSGTVYPDSLIKDIVEMCQTKDIYLIMDDIYHRLVFDGVKPVSVFNYIKDFNDDSKVIVINGVSKQYAMTGFRIGWGVANKNLIATMSNIQAHQTSGPSILPQIASVAAIYGDQSSVESLRLTLENNRNVLIDLLNSIEGVKVTKPKGTFYSFADFSYYEKDSNKLSAYLIDNAKVLTVPGIGFGVDGYLRISYCGSLKDITEGIQRIKKALASYSPDK